MELTKNNRFRTGSVVDIYHTPVYETNTISIEDLSVGNNYTIKATFEEDVRVEQFSVGDLCALSFGVGEISVIEQSQTNFFLYSEQLSNAAWTKEYSNIVEDIFTFPFGGYSGDRLESIDTSTVNRKPVISQTIVKDAVVKKYTLSFYARSGDLNTGKVTIVNSVGSEGVIVDFSTLTGQVGLPTEVGGFQLQSYTVSDDLGDGWKRHGMIFQSDDDIGLDVEIEVTKSGFLSGFPSVGGEGFYIRGLQINDGSLIDYVETTDTIINIVPIDNSIELIFPKSMFPNSDVMKYVGSSIQHCLFFLKTGRVVANFAVAKYTEIVNQAIYGYAKVVYNLQTQANLVLTPITMVDDGTLNAILYSKGYILKSCNDDDYETTSTWDTEFPLELSGTSIDPVYRRAYLIKRAMESRSRKAKARLEFQLIG